MSTNCIRYTTFIIKGGTIAAQVYKQAIAYNKDLINLLHYTSIIIALLFDR
jgi:hypothetical protein